jgi:ubiquinone/menaquinone biosynthesis C-methylase UbiE
MAELNIKVFTDDVNTNGGYRYTTNTGISAKMANQRLTDAILAATDMKGKSVIDVGCGDGTYTIELLKGSPKSILGVDLAESALNIARRKAEEKGAKIDFVSMSAYELEKLNQQFDVAVVRGVIHHLYEPKRAIAALAKIAKEIIVVEPNGNNIILKVIERTSKYHIEHEERSYFPFVLDRWFAAHGGKVESYSFAGLVPMFCPDWFARILKPIEPWIEKMPIIRALSCAVYVQKIRMPDKS